MDSLLPSQTSPDPHIKETPRYAQAVTPIHRHRQGQGRHHDQLIELIMEMHDMLREILDEIISYCTRGSSHILY